MEQNVPEIVANTNVEAATSSPTAVPDVSQQWLQPYINTNKGLPSLYKQLLRNPDMELMQAFSSSFKSVYIKTTTAEDGTPSTSYVYPDEVGFYQCYQQWMDISNNKEAQPAHHFCQIGGGSKDATHL